MRKKLSKILLDMYLFLKHLIEVRSLIWDLSVRDFKQKFFGSYLSFAWAFIQPLVFTLMLWFIFTVGVRSSNRTIGNVPFFIWLMCGLFAWYFFTEGLNNGCTAIKNYKYLVVKIKFRTSILPIVRITSASFIHFFLMILFFIIYIIHTGSISVYNLQFFYYFFAMMLLLIGVSWLTSSINVFITDMGYLIGVISQVGFWFTPIFWEPNRVGETLQIILKLNPMYYIVYGYRDSFIHKEWFWEKPLLTLYFWSFTFIVFALGAYVFKKLRPHFGDVL